MSPICGGIPGKFAHDSISILSRKALELLISSRDKCTKKYSKCPNQEIVPELCLRDNHVFLSDSPHIYTNEPTENSFGNPCDKPISFSKLKDTHFLKFYQIEEQSKRLVTNSDIAPRVLNEEMKMDTTRLNKNYQQFYEDLVSRCEQSCINDDKCVSFVHKDNQCYLQDIIPPPVISKGSISGIVFENYYCNQ
jgi:hypothetical protein